MRSLVVALLVLAGCSTQNTEIDPRLSPVLEQWRSDCILHLDSSACDTRGIRSIKLVPQIDQLNRVLGQCRIGPFNKDILIRDDIPLDGYYMRTVFLHEMLHCRYEYEAHTESGIMGEELSYSEETLADKWAELLAEAYALVK